ncbi:MAG: L-2-amino-thiazoline-4-carboxylic acid hydrolase [Isosphaeraceae bacterium]
MDRLLQQAWREFDRLAPLVPQEPTIGSRMNVRLACFTLAFLQATTAAGVERSYAIELIADAAWKIYKKWAALPRLVARLVSRDPIERMDRSINAFLRFPFNPPAYVFERLATDDGTAFHVRRCPVADYFRAHSAPDLCGGTWCNLDYALAELWGGKLGRTTTLVEGYDRCNFHFKAVR